MRRGCDEALQVKKGFLSEKGGGNSVNQAFGKDFYHWNHNFITVSYLISGH